MSKDILCPKCGESIIIKINNYKISLFNCKNGHKVNNILLDEYKNLKKNFNVEIKYICDKHNKKYNNYCNNCKKNICESCDKEHKNHEIINFEDIKQDLNEIINKKKELRKNIDEFNKNIKEINNKLNKISENVEIYFDLIDSIINNYENKNLDYQNIQNIIEFKKYNINITKDIKEIIKSDNINDKFNNLMEIYLKMNPIDEITILYKKTQDENNKEESENNIKLLGEEFVQNNKNNCKLIYQGKEFELKSFLELDKKNIKKDEVIKIKLKGIRKITNMSNMFINCPSLYSLPDISKMDT